MVRGCKNHCVRDTVKPESLTQQNQNHITAKHKERHEVVKYDTPVMLGRDISMLLRDRPGDEETGGLIPGMPLQGGG